MTELEKMKYARNYIYDLANGINPLTGGEEPNDEMLNNVHLCRCFFYVSEILDRVIENGGEVNKKPKIPFDITDEEIKSIELSREPVGITMLLKRVKEALPVGMKTPSIKTITQWLLDDGYLTEEIVNNRRRKIATAKGEGAGLNTIDSVSMEGVPYKKIIYDIDAQKMVINNLIKLSENS